MLIKDNMAVKYSKTEKTPDMVYIDYGATIFKKEALQFVPANSRYGLEDLFVHLIDMKQMLALEVGDRFYEIGSPQGLRDFEEY